MDAASLRFVKQKKETTPQLSDLLLFAPAQHRGCAFAYAGHDWRGNPRMKFNRDIKLERMMTEWPATIDVLLRYRMLCVGCPISDFHSPVDAAREHGADLDALERDLAATIETDRPD
jgi:hybrid cluster-associated redox disulfide protein